MHAAVAHGMTTRVLRCFSYSPCRTNRTTFSSWHRAFAPARRPSFRHTALQTVCLRSAVSQAAEVVAKHAIPNISPAQIAAEVDKEARIVLIGDATHGTSDFYRDRAEITKELIQRHGFNAVSVEAG